MRNLRLRGLHDVPKVIQLASAGGLGLKSDTPIPEQWVRLTARNGPSVMETGCETLQISQCFMLSSLSPADDHSYSQSYLLHCR